MDIPIKTINEEIERWLLINFVYEKEKSIAPHASDDIKNILSGNYKAVITGGLDPDIVRLLQNSDNFQQIISDSIQKNVEFHGSWLCIGIASLLQFVQYNWTGPQIDDDDDWLSVRRKEAIECLSLNDECNENIIRPELLYFTKVIFSNDFLQTSYKSSVWWWFRSNLLHSFVLEESLAILFEETENIIQKLDELNTFQDLYCKTLLNAEIAQFYFYYRRIQHSEKYLDCAANTAKLTCELQGAMGKRTKYQQEEKSQLYLKVAMERECCYSRHCQNVPKSIELNDDVRLDHIDFSEAIDKVELGALEETIILAKYVQLQLSQPKDKLTDEQLMPYLSNVIESTKNWTLKLTSLYHRCCIEANDKRSIERSMMQMEYLLQEINNRNVPVQERLDFFFASGLKPVWRLEEVLANIMFSLGLAKGALDIFLKLKIWDDVIVCYNILNLNHKAAEIIRQQIERNPTVKLWCLLGDATREVEHYETAWKLSAERSSRAQRHWGLFYFAKKNYEEAIPHLKLSLELNSIQENVWLKLGFAALQVEDWKLAATAYRRYCAMEQTTFEAWNNLAKAYIKLGEKERAWRSLQDAIKCNYDRWEVWDNLMVVSIDLGHFSEVIRCYHRILDLKGQHMDGQILSILSNAIINDVKDSEGNPSRRLLKKTLELFGRITSNACNDPDVWKAYAELTLLKETRLDNQKATRYLQQAYRCILSDSKWFQTVESTRYVLELSCDLTTTYLNCASSCTEVVEKRSMLASAKLSLRGIVKRAKDQSWSDAHILKNLERAEECLKNVTDELEKSLL